MAKENKWIENIFDFKESRSLSKPDLNNVIDRFGSIKTLKKSKKMEKVRSQLFNKNNYQKALSNMVS